MTRDFNKQRRDDSRPSFRDRSSNNRGEERSSNPARPRLNRETVDRAWESGAQHQHADYHSRSNNGQPTRNNWRNQQPSGYSSSSQNGHGGNRPYNTNRQEHNRDNSRGFERTSDDSYGPRSPRARSFGPNNADRQHYDNSRPGAHSRYDNSRPGERSHYNNSRPGERRPYDNQRPGGERPYSPGTRPDYRRDNNRPGNRDERFRGQDQGRDNRRTDFERNERSYTNERRGPGQYNQHYSGSDTRSPRWQSRTWTRQASPEERQEHSSRASEQFEGDYERFNNNDSHPAQRGTSYRDRGSRPEANTFRSRPGRNYTADEPAQERHVTRLPDGRVLKGSRPVQRQEARFWSEVADDTEGLINKIPTENKEVDEAQNVEVDGAIPATEDKPSKKLRARSASATVRSRKTGEAKEKTRSPKGPRPSQRGFKWPTA